MIQKIKDTATKVGDFAAKYWLVGTSLVIAILYYVLQRRGETIADLQAQIQRQKLENELKSLKEVETADAEKFNKSRSDYLALKRRYPHLFDS